MTTTPEDRNRRTADLVASTDRLTQQVQGLVGAVSAAQELAARTRRITIGLVVFVVAVCAGAGVFWYQIRETVKANEDNAVTACQNANDSRIANRALWSFVVDLNRANPDLTRKDKAFLDQAQGYIDDLYAARDCADLSKRYPLPKPPTLRPDRN